VKAHDWIINVKCNSAVSYVEFASSLMRYRHVSVISAGHEHPTTSALVARNMHIAPIDWEQ